MTERLCGYVSTDGEPCERPMLARGLCNAHYAQQRKGKALRPVGPHPGPRAKTPIRIGDRFGSLVAVAPINRDKAHREWAARCDCGVDLVVRASDLRLGRRRCCSRLTCGLRTRKWTLNKNGYLVKNLGGVQVKQHRYVMEQYLGRPLLPHENVHHINGDRTDNNIENLELWSSCQPSGQRVADKIAWAREILDMYEPSRRVGGGCGET